MSWSKFEEFLQANPNLQQVLSAPAIVDPYSVGRMKTDSAFNERLKQIKKNNPSGDIKTGNITTL